MRIVVDLHIHSPYSRATSRDMSFKNLEKGGIVKGLDVLGTGDFTHPKWREEIRAALVEENGLYRLRDGGRIRYIVSGEVCTNFEHNGKTRRIHHIILLPSMEVAEQLIPIFEKRGSLEGDGRPNLSMTGSELVEVVSDLGEGCMVIPAHIWTPWFSLFGARGGVDRIEECYDDQTPHIYALETGLSSDPPMNWRVSALDQYTLVSNSDSHSPSPWRIGREANILEVSRLSYKEIVETIMHRKGDVITIEVDPAYGKYHWTGHRNCNVSLPPDEAIKLKGICPVCGKKMTKGVAERVEELADRGEGAVPEGAQKFIRLLPLSEIIATVFKKDVFSGEVQKQYWRTVNIFVNELEVLMKALEERLVEACGREIAEMILMSREGRLAISPGYDGVYGRPVDIGGNRHPLEDHPTGKEERFLRRKNNLDDYIDPGR